MEKEKKEQNVCSRESILPDGSIQRVSTTLFGCEKDKSGKVTKTMAEMRKSFQDENGDFSKEALQGHTKTLEFDFSGVSIGELVDLHLKTTTVYKKYYNDYLFNIEDSVWVAKPDVIPIKVKELLSERGRKPANPEKAFDTFKKAFLARGAEMTPEEKEKKRQELAQLLELLT